MSGGKDRSKTRSSKAQGWEEAGAEFYQESYPADLEGVMQRDPAAIATLLPSKQTRNATTRRGRPQHNNQQDTKSTRKQQQQQQSSTRRRNSSVRRGSQYHNEVQVSMLPDLSENLTDEERIWEEIHEIKSMPISMAEKKQMKAQLQNATKLRLQGFDQIKWQRRKVWQQLESKWKEYLTKLELWNTSLKTIEGNFGTGVVAYFVFLRWLMFLNLIIFLLIFSFIVLPQITLFENELYVTTSTTTTMYNTIIDSNLNDDGFCDINSTSIKCCSELYFKNETDQMESSQSTPFILLDIIQGTGYMERTIIFYGMYSNKIYGYDVPSNEGKSTQSTSSQSTSATTIASFNNNNNNNNNLTNGQRQSMPTTETDTKKTQLYYNLPLAYISVSAVYFLLSLAAIIKSAARGFKDRLVEGEGQFYQYCNLIFGGWDFCIHNEKSAIIKHKALYNELSGLLQAKRMEIDRQNRSSDVICKLYAIRAIINLLVIIILATSAYLIYTLIEISTTNLRLLRDNSNFNDNNINNNMETKIFNLSSSINYTQLNTNGFYHTSPSMLTRDANYYRNSKQSVDDQWSNLFFEFLPYIAIVGLNLIVPIGFNYLVQFEKYLPVFVIKITLVRTVLLRLASLCVLLTRIYLDVSVSEYASSDTNDTMLDDGGIMRMITTNTTNTTQMLDNNNNNNENSTDFLVMVARDIPLIKMSTEMKCLNGANHLCWETFVGQQFYKLLITDFFIHFAVTFLINFPRSIIAKYTKNNWMRFLCEQEFELPKHVLDIVYSQTLCWLGSFYAPFLTAIAVVLHFFMFYIKRFQCLVNSKPSAILYRASRSNSLFMFTLLFAFFLAFCSIVFAVAELRPSRACGPYRGLTTVWMSAVTTFTALPDQFKSIFFFIGTAGFAIPVLIILILFLYYYYAVSAANKHMVDVLKNQLILEGHDKQFLLNRLSSFLKQQQEYQKKMRQAELRQQRDRERDRQQQQHQQTPSGSAGGGGSSMIIGAGNANTPNSNNNMDSQ